MDAWKTIRLPFGARPIFFGKLLVLGRVINMVNKSPKDRVVPLPNGHSWHINGGDLNHLITGMILNLLNKKHWGWQSGCLVWKS